MKGLTELSAASANAPDDPAAFAKLQEAAQRVAHLTHQLIGDTGKEAALQVAPPTPPPPSQFLLSLRAPISFYTISTL